VIEINCVVAKNKYGQYAVPPETAHRPAAKLAIDGDVYEPDTIQFMLDNCGSGSIIHAGTFFGDFLPALGSTGNKVYAFEPVKRNYDHAVVTLSMNFIEHNIELFNYGLGEANKTESIIHTGHTGESLGGGARYNYNRAGALPEHVEDTTVVTLDSIVADHGNVSILQLDVEGYEENALKGALSIIEKSSPIIILECWHENMFDTDFFRDEIFGKGYVRDGVLHDNVILRKV
jgi:FkbM family methyltransferase